MEFHEVVLIWPKMQPDEFAKLVSDIQANGLREPIWTYQGKIVDGRHRYLACKDAGVEPRYREWDGQGSLVMFVASLNQHRRHLDAGQRAMVALDLEKHLAVEAEKRTGGRPRLIDQKPVERIQPVSSGRASVQAASLVGTNMHYVVDAKKIAEKAPELKPLVMDRVISLPDAKKLAKEEAPVRQAVIEKIASGQASKVGSALLELKKEENIAQAQSAPSKPYIAQASWETWLPQQPMCDLLITDPPYSTDIDDIEAFANSWLPLALSKVKRTGRAYVCIGAYPRELQVYLNVQASMQVQQVLVWSYRNTIGPSPTHNYKQNWQAILYFCGPDAPPLNCPILNEQFSAQEINAPDGRAANRYHAWQKPDELAERLIRHSTNAGDTVIDCFAGTGTFLLAAHRLGRVALGCDQSPVMIDLARTRGCEVKDAA